MKLLSYPNLPMLHVGDCLKALRILGLRATDLAVFTGYSNPAAYNWMLRQPPTALPVINAVNELAYRVFAGFRRGLLPLSDNLRGAARMAALTDVLFVQINLFEIDPATASSKLRPYVPPSVEKEKRKAAKASKAKNSTRGNVDALDAVADTAAAV